MRLIEKKRVFNEDEQRSSANIAATLSIISALMVLFVIVTRPLFSPLPEIFVQVGVVNTSVLLCLGILLKKGYFQSIAGALFIGVLSALLLFTFSISGGANSHHNVIIPLLPLGAMLIGGLRLAVVVLIFWICVFIAFIFLDISKLDVTQSQWEPGKLVARTMWLILSSIAGLILAVLFENRNRRLQSKLFYLTEIDPLTEIGNRRAMERELNKQLTLSSRTKSWLTLMVIDVDYFKKFNDINGHSAGDQVLKTIAETLNKLARKEQDKVTRFGGEEFVVVLSNTDAKAATRVAEKFRKNIADLNILYREDDPHTLTITIGFYSLQASASETPETIIEKADLALYQGKEKGRNCVVSYEEIAGDSKPSPG
jgi:diguanylate cyclase (GGDEF)-like protein